MKASAFSFNQVGKDRAEEMIQTINELKEIDFKPILRNSRCVGQSAANSIAALGLTEDLLLELAPHFTYLEIGICPKILSIN